MRSLRGAVRWIEDELGPEARVVRARPLRGGVASLVHEVTVACGRSTTHVVLRRHESRTDEHARIIAREAGILQGLVDTAIPAPRLLAADPRGERAGDPALLMTKLPGKVSLAPTDMEAWLRRLARQLCAIHDLPTIGELLGGTRPAQFDPPSLSARKDLWARAIDVLAAGMPEATCRRLHGDYQHFNILWSRGRVSGVLDWVSSRDGRSRSTSGTAG